MAAGAGSHVAVKPDCGVAVPRADCADVGTCRWSACGGCALLSFGSSVLPAGCIDGDCFEVVLDGVCEAQQRSTSTTSAIAQFSVENLSLQALRLHAVDMSKPVEATLNEHRGYAHEISALKDLSVWEFVLPFDVQKLSKRAEVELVEV